MLINPCIHVLKSEFRKCNAINVKYSSRIIELHMKQTSFLLVMLKAKMEEKDLI